MALQEQPSAADPDGHVSPGEQALSGLLEAAHFASADELPRLIAQHAGVLGARDVTAYLVDLQQGVLVPFLGAAGPGAARQLKSLAVDATLAGRAFRQLELVVQDGGDQGAQVWLPLLNGSERLGALSVVLDSSGVLDQPDGLLARRLRGYASLVAELITTKTLYGDSIVRTRRLAGMGLAAEVQWGLLPPLTFASAAVAIAGALEPAYSVAGDSIDYAVETGQARLAVFDAMGHGLTSAQFATLAVAAYRNARRAGRSLSETARAVDNAVTTGFAGESFATGVLAELDTDTGLLSWVNAGHPPPLLLRDHRLVKTLESAAALPLGLDVDGDTAHRNVVHEQLQPGDRVLLYSDGVTEARSPDGDFFGVERLVDLLTRHLAGDLPAPETLRRIVHALLHHQQGQLGDDATLLLLEWRGTTAAQMS